MKRLRIHGMRWHTVAFGVCMVASIGLMVGGFFVPLTGVIDGSVLTAVGLLFGYATLGQLHSLVSRGKNGYKYYIRIENDGLLRGLLRFARQSVTARLTWL